MASYFDIKIERWHFMSQCVVLCDCSLLHHLHPVLAGASPALVAQQDVMPGLSFFPSLIMLWKTPFAPND